MALDVAGRAAGGRGRRDQPLDQGAEVEQHLELGPRRQQRLAHRVARRRPVEGLHEGAAVAPAVDRDEPLALEALQRLADRRAGGAEHPRQLTLGGQPLALDELAQGDGGDHPIGDLLGGVATVERQQPAAHVVGCRTPRSSSRAPGRSRRGSGRGSWRRRRSSAARRARRCRGCRPLAARSRRRGRRTR